MPLLIEEIGSKEAGELIRAADFNKLVQALDALTGRIGEFEQNVQQRFEKVDQTFEQFEGRITDLIAQVEQLDERVANLEKLRDEYYRLTLESTKTHYAIGQLADITARIVDLNGKPIAGAWVDFVATWGRLGPHSEFVSRGGVDDRAISVQTNGDGLARVWLRSEQAEGFSEEEELDVAKALATPLAQNNNQSIADTILAAETPMQAKQQQAFFTLSKEYDRGEANVPLRDYLDAHFVKQPAILSSRIQSKFVHNWRDYRSIVFAFVKADNDPTTPDYSRGASSTQITFRDWIFPWFTLEYLEAATIEPLVLAARDKLQPKITKNFAKSVSLLKTEVKELVAGKGYVAKLRDYRVVHQALDRINVADPPDFLNDLTKSVQDAVEIQQVFEQSQAGGLSIGTEKVAFEVFTNAATRTDPSKVDAVSRDLSNVQQTISRHDGQFDAVATLRSEVESVKSQVQILGGVDVDEVRRSVTNIRNLNDRLALLEGRNRPG